MTKGAAAVLVLIGLAGLAFWCRGRGRIYAERAFLAVCGANAVLFPAVWIARYWPFEVAHDARGWAVGCDFAVFFVMAKLATIGGPALYDFERQHGVQRDFLNGYGPEFLPALYPPFVPALLRPLASLSYFEALAVFTCVSTLCMTAALTVWLRKSPALRSSEGRRAAVIVFFGCPLFWEVLCDAQGSFLAFLSFGCASALCLRGPVWSVPILMSLAAYKPNVLAFPYLAMMIRWPRLIPPTLGCVAALIALGGFAEGWGAWDAYLRVPFTVAGARAISAPPISAFHGLAGTLPSTRNWPVRFVVGGVGLAAVTATAVRWRRFPSGNVQANAAAMGVTCLIGLLANPYVPIYDLVLLLPVLACAHAGGLFRSTSDAMFAAFALCAGPHFTQWIAVAMGNGTRAVQFHPFVLLAFALYLASRAVQEGGPLGRVAERAQDDQYGAQRRPGTIPVTRRAVAATAFSASIALLAVVQAGKLAGEAAGHVEISTVEEVDVGAIPVGGIFHAKVTIRNHGNRDVRLSVVDGNASNVAAPELPTTLPARGVDQIVLEGIVSERGPFRRTLLLETLPEYGVGRLSIAVTGAAVKESP